MKRAIFIFCFAPILFLGCDDGKSNKLKHGGGGDLEGYNCASIHRCVKHCGSDEACRDDCLKSGSVDGAKSYANLGSCIGYNCTFMSEDETADCINKFCANELGLCGLGEAEAGDFEPSAPAGGDSGSDSGDSGSDSGDSAADSGDSAADSGDSTADSGDSTADSGDSGEDSGDSTADSGDSGADSGNSAADSGDSAADSGNSAADSGDSAADSGNSAADSGNSGADSGNSAADSGDSAADSGDSAADSGDSAADSGDSAADSGDSALSEFCGDGILNGSEFCDDGEFNGKYGYCKSDCSDLGERCGDRIVNGSEFCDDGENNGKKYGYCKSDCSEMGPYCGDKIVNGSEFCDDGDKNGTSGHCASNCKTLVVPYRDYSSGLMWSSKSSANMGWEKAKTYCEDLEDGGFSDWRLPTISELRTLIRNCPATMTGGSCGVTDSCLESSCRDDSCSGCGSNNTGKYSLFGDTYWFWSSSPVADNPVYAWYVDFDGGNVGSLDMVNNIDVRCVRWSRGRVFPICRRLFAFWRRRYSP